MAKRGRKSTYSQEIADAICARLALGESLRSICRDEGMPPDSTVRMWVVDNVEEFAAQYARSRDIGLDAMAEQVFEIADDSSQDTIITDGGAKPNGEWISRSRLRFDARRWYLSKMAPKRYGDKTETTLKGDGTAPLNILISPSDGRL